MLTTLRKTLLSTALLAIPVVAPPFVTTPANAQSYKMKIQPPKPRITIPEPKIRVKPNTKRLVKEKQLENVQDPNKAPAKISEEPPASKTTNLENIAKPSNVENAAQAAAAAEAARQIKEFDPSIGEIAKAGLGIGPDGDGGGTSSTMDWARSFLPDPSSIPTGGLASDNAEVTKTVYDDGTVTVTKTVDDQIPGHTVKTEAHYDQSGRQDSYKRTIRRDSDGTGHVDHRNDQGNGVAYDIRRNGDGEWEPDPNGGVTDFTFFGRQSQRHPAANTDFWNGPWLDSQQVSHDFSRGAPVPRRDLVQTKTGDEETGGVLPPPNCGSKACNEMRKGLSIRSAVKGGVRVNPGAGAGADGTTPTGSGPSVTTYINQDDLVKSDIAGGAESSTRNRTLRELKGGGVRY